MVSHLPATGGMSHCGYYLAILPPKRASSFSESLKGTFGDFGVPKKKVGKGPAMKRPSMVAGAARGHNGDHCKLGIPSQVSTMRVPAPGNSERTGTKQAFFEAGTRVIVG